MTLRKLICIGSAVIFALTALCGCGERKTESSPETVDVEYFVKLGKCPECDYALGADIDAMTAELTALYNPDGAEAGGEADGELATEQEHGEGGFFEVYERESYVWLSTEGVSYYYRAQAKDRGVSYIALFNGAYGFELGTVSVEIKNALSEYSPDERELLPGEAFFLPGGMSTSCLEYSFGKNRVMFVFVDNALCATALYSPDNWSV